MQVARRRSNDYSQPWLDSMKLPPLPLQRTTSLETLTVSLQVTSVDGVRVESDCREEGLWYSCRC